MTVLIAPSEQQRLELAQNQHTPTKSMVSAAKRGLNLAKAQDGIDVTALTVGKRIASGRKLTSDHVHAMAAHHAGHNYDCPTGSSKEAIGCALWGGPSGAGWSAARSSAMDASQITATATYSDDGDEAESLEVFVRDGIGEPLQLDDGDDSLIWAPILRSGMLATRPGPNGEKVREPLVFVPGIASDPRKEIGLQNLYDSFKSNAVQHVTIPTTHENGVLDNTGYIVDVKIVDSKKRPGEKVLMGAHRFTEPEVKEKVQRGSVANRSCGILYDHVNTETGEHYDQALEHVALTNKPWVTGMAAYGQLSEEDLSERNVIPMLLSEGPVPTHLADNGVSDAAWDGAASRFTDEQYQKSCLVNRGGDGSVKEKCSLPVREPDGTLNRNAVHSAAGMIAKLGDVSTAQKRAAARKLVSLYKSKLKEDPPVSLSKLAAVSTAMSAEERKADLALADVQWGDEPSLNEIRSQVLDALEDFRRQGEPGGPPYYYVMDVTAAKALVRVEYGYDSDDDDDAWVVPFDVDDSGEVTLADFSQWVPVTQEWVTDEDAAQDKAELGAILGADGMPVPETEATTTSSSSDLAERDSAHNQQGGAVKPTIEETLARLDLSDEAKAVMTQLAEENARNKTALAEATKEAKKERVTTRVADLQAKGFPPGFCAKFERIALGDDGQVAAVLNLSESASATPTDFTATQIAEELISALPVDDSGKLALAEQGNLLESPISGRPDLDTTEQAEREEREDKKAPQTGAELAEEWRKSAPEAVATLHLDDDNKEA